MRRIPTWNPTNTNWSGNGGGGGGGGDGGGGGGSTTPNSPIPPAPRNVRAKVTDIGRFTVSWQDYEAADWPYDSPFFWMVRFCPASIAGSASSRPETTDSDPSSWSTDVLSKSKHIASLPAEGRGRSMSINHVEDLPDGYIQVVGSSGSYAGQPSYPILLRLTLNGDVSPDVGMIGPLFITYTKERVPRDVIRIDGQYGIIGPPELNEFDGVHPHIVDYGGIATPREVGSMARWDGSTGLNNFTYKLPIELGQANGFALFTSGSANVLWISGDTFSAGYVGRNIIADLSSTTAAQTYVVNTFTDATHISLNAVWGYTTGTYLFKIFSETIWYFVPIGKSGARVGDITTAANITL